MKIVITILNAKDKKKDVLTMFKLLTMKWKYYKTGITASTLEIIAQNQGGQNVSWMTV